MNEYPSGKRVFARLFNQALSTTPIALPFKDEEGNAHTFAAGERLVIYESHCSNRAATGLMTVGQDTNGNGAIDAGEELFSHAFDATFPDTSDHLNSVPGIPAKRINAAATNTFLIKSGAAATVDIVVVAEVIR